MFFPLKSNTSPYSTYLSNSVRKPSLFNPSPHHLTLSKPSAVYHPLFFTLFSKPIKLPSISYWRANQNFKSHPFRFSPVHFHISDINLTSFYPFQILPPKLSLPRILFTIFRHTALFDFHPYLSQPPCLLPTLPVASPLLFHPPNQPPTNPVFKSQ